MRLTKAQAEFLEELAFENPAPEEKWMKRGNWDPSFPLGVIDAAAKRGLIETRGERRDPENYEFRFTAAGRTALQQAEGDK